MTKCKVCGKEIEITTEFDYLFAEKVIPDTCGDACSKILRDKKIKENYENDKTPLEHQGGVSKHVWPQ